jgi:hypothetical protein
MGLDPPSGGGKEDGANDSISTGSLQLLTVALWRMNYSRKIL